MRQFAFTSGILKFTRKVLKKNSIGTKGMGGVLLKWAMQQNEPLGMTVITLSSCSLSQ